MTESNKLREKLQLRRKSKRSPQVGNEPKEEIKETVKEEIVDQPSESRIKLRRTVDSEPERKLLINLIINDEACKVLLPQIIAGDLQASYSATIVRWIKNFYDTEHRAPGKDIEPVFETLKKGVEPSEGKLVERLLEILSTEYESYEDIENTLSIFENKQYLRKQHAKRHTDEVNKWIEIGDIDKAERKAEGYKPIFAGTDAPALSQSVATFGQVLGEEFEEPQLMIDPWLIDGSISEIYGPRGIGKTWLGLIIGLVISRGKGIGTKIGPWEVAHPGGILYLDGEMGRHQMQKQLQLLKNGLKDSGINYPFDILTYDKFLEDRNTMLNLSKEELREEVFQYLKEHEKYNLLILDNVASLFPGLDEDKKQQWDPVNQWLLAIKALNVSVIFIHHAGKSGKQRGTSGREDNINVVLKLSQPPGYESKMGAYFKIEFEKTRGIAPGSYLAPFTLKVIESGQDGVTWEIKEMANNKDLINALILQGEKTQKEIAEIVGVSQGTVSTAKKALIKNGLLDKNGNITQKGGISLSFMVNDGVLNDVE